VILALLLMGCASRTAPVLFPTPLPALTPAEAPPIAAQADECSLAAAYVPGRAPPFVVDGLVTCRAQVVPESQVLELVVDADAAAYWEPVARACYDARTADRLHAQSSLELCHADGLYSEREARVLRVVAPALFTGGLVVGTALGLAYGIAAGALTP